MTITRWATALALSCALFASPAQAGLLEDLLAKPAIQSLLTRMPDLQASLKQCADARFRQRNAAVCEQADQAARLAAMPPELRAVLAVPASAASLRELCLAAQGGPRQNSHLCAEMSKADAGFKALADQQRQIQEQQRAPAAPAESSRS